MQKRIYLEALRIIALLCIMFNHTGEYGYLLFQVTDHTILRLCSIFLSNLCKIGVPLFFMISGALLLPKKESLKDLFFKRILRILIVLVVFSFIYYIRLYVQHPEYGFSLFFFVKLIYSEPFITPFWFLYAYLSFLLMLPFLRPMACNMSDSAFVYLGVLAVLLLFFVKMPEYVLGCSINISLPVLEMNLVFPLLGYFLEHRLAEKFYVRKYLPMAVIAILINGCCCILMTVLEFSKTGVYDVNFVESFTLLPALGVFFLIRYTGVGKEKTDASVITGFAKAIVYIGSCVFCTYLFEEMLRIDLFMKLFDSLCPPVPSLLVCIPYMTAILAAGVLISTVLKKIPGVKWLKL